MRRETNLPRATRFGFMLVVVALSATRTEAADFQAGFATADITPPVGWRRAQNYNEVISGGVLDPLQTKAVVVVQGETAFAFVGNDLCSVPRELTDRARREAAEATGVPFENIVITATHTHGGPEYFGPLRDVLHERSKKENGGVDPREPIDYQALLVERWVDVIRKAHADRRDVELSVVVPRQDGVAFNRRFLMKDGSTGWNPGQGALNIFRPLGPTDPDLPFVLARDATTGAPVGSLAVFAMHAAIHGGREFSACFPGHLETNLRRSLDAPDFVSIFGEGCAGDVNHIDVNGNDALSRNAYPAVVGARLAETIVKALPFARTIKGGELAVRSATVHSPVTPITDNEVANAESLLEKLDREKRPFLVTVDAWRKMFQRKYWETSQGRLPQEVQVFRLDRDTALVTLPHEIFVELGMAIKAASPFRTTIVASLANDLDFYVPTRRAFEEGNYEPTTCPLEPGCGELLVRTAVKLLNDLKP